MPRNATQSWQDTQVLGLRLTGPRRELLEQAMQRRGLPFSKQNATACIEWALAHVTAASCGRKEMEMVKVMWTNELGSGDARTHRWLFESVEQARNVVLRDLHNNDKSGYCPPVIYDVGQGWCHLYGKQAPVKGWRDWDAVWSGGAPETYRG